MIVSFSLRVSATALNKRLTGKNPHNCFLLD